VVGQTPSLVAADRKRGAVAVDTACSAAETDPDKARVVGGSTESSPGVAAACALGLAVPRFDVDRTHMVMGERMEMADEASACTQESP